MARILIVDDDEAVREALAEAVLDLGHEPVTAASGSDALRLTRGGDIQAMFLDLRMPDMEGLEVLRQLARRDPMVATTVLTAHATAANTIEAMRLGACDHLTKPMGRAGIARAVDAMLGVTSGAAPRPADQSQAPLVGASEAMRTVQKTIGMVADTTACVLITGETGTGKELVARAIHDFGRRQHAPFVALNCASIPSELIESELFGHVRGAFTGALNERAGAFRLADGGTLLLDEIGDMDLAMQAKLLRALQEREITPVGGRPLRVDVRVIAATHRDLRSHVREGGFREDLFYRLHVVPLHLPPLRERTEDIVPLAGHFLAAAGSRKRLSPAAIEVLMRHRWPGNVRELKNTLERLAILVRSDVITGADLNFLQPERMTNSEPVAQPGTLPEAIAALEERMIRETLILTHGNRTEAARRLDINRQLLHIKIKRYGLTDASHESSGHE
jgi:DNA-binding NtrC family response regulator